MTPDPAGVPDWLRRLVTALPGVSGEQLSRFLPPSTGGRHSAVLVLFGEGDRGPDVLLIERAHTMRSHAGQPAFPGGALDPEDGAPTGPGPVAAALREAQEEVGLDPTSVEVLGQLPALFLPPSGCCRVMRWSPEGWWARWSRRDLAAGRAEGPGRRLSPAGRSKGPEPGPGA